MKVWHIIALALIGVYLYATFIMKPGGAKVTPPGVKGPSMPPPVRSGGTPADAPGVASNIGGAHKL